MPNYNVFILLLTVALAPLSVIAAEMPSEQQLSNRLGTAIAPFWSVSKLEVTASVNAGDAVDPKVKQRFQAMVTPDRALFVKDERAGAELAPYIPVVPSLKPKESRVLYGVARSTYSAGNWNIELAMENTVSDLGRPKSMFSGPTLVRGSKREQEVVAVLAANVAQKIQRQAQEKIREQKADNKAELRAARSAHAKKIAETKAKFQAAKRDLEHKRQALARKRSDLKNSARRLRARMDAVSAKHDARIRALKAANAKTLDKLRAKQAAEQRAQKQNLEGQRAANHRQIAKINRNHRHKVAALQSDRKAELARLEKAHADEVATVKAKHDAKLAALRQKQQKALEQIKGGYRQKTEALRVRIAKLAKLASLHKRKKQKEKELAAARKKALTERAQRNQALLATFRDKISVDDADARRSAFAAALENGNTLLRRTAIKAALDGDDPVLRQNAFNRGLNSGDKMLERAAIQAGLSGKDKEQRTRAINAALGSKDRGLQQAALAEILATTNAVTGIYIDQDKQHPFTLNVSEYDSGTGAIKGELLGWDYCDNMTGNLTGNTIAMGNDEGCQAHFSAAAGGKMKGSLVDYRGNRYESTTTIGS